MERDPYERRFNGMKNEAISWTPTWKMISDYVMPMRGFFEGELPNQGKRRDLKMIDNSPMRASDILSAGMQSGMTSPGRPWYRLGAADPDYDPQDDAKDWLNIVQGRMLQIFSRSNIYNSLHSIYGELGDFGTGAVILHEDFEDVIRGEYMTIGEYYLGVSRRNMINAFAREIYMTVWQMVEEFGIDNVSRRVREAYDNHRLDEWFTVYHLIEPNDDRIPDKKDFKNMPFRSVYWEKGGDKDRFLRLSGYNEFPVLAPRWNLLRSRDVYGNGPGHRVLGDSKMMQKLREDQFLGLDKMMNPPVNVPASSQVYGGVNALPNGVNYYNDENANAQTVRATYQVQVPLKEIEYSAEQFKDSISKHYYNDLFLMLASQDRPQMTAREVAERHEEKLLMLGPVLERLERELLDPLIDRTFNIMLRKNLLPPPPKSLQGMPLKIEYISVLAQAQRMVGITAIEQSIGFIGNIAALFPEAKDKLDVDEAIDQYTDMLGTPPKIIRSDDMAGKIRTDRAQQQAAMIQAQNAAAAVQGAKVLSETDTGGNNALTALLGGGGV